MITCNVYMNFAKITRDLTKLRNSNLSETFSRLPAVSILLGDTNHVTVKSGKSETNESVGSF